MTMTSRALIDTQQAERLVLRLCKHWGHKFPVTHTPGRGEIELPLGRCRLHGAAALTVELESDAEQLARLQQIVADHLQRMARDETLVITWQ